MLPNAPFPPIFLSFSPTLTHPCRVLSRISISTAFSLRFRRIPCAIDKWLSARSLLILLLSRLLGSRPAPGFLALALFGRLSFSHSPSAEFLFVSTCLAPAFSSSSFFFIFFLLTQRNLGYLFTQFLFFSFLGFFVATFIIVPSAAHSHTRTGGSTHQRSTLAEILRLIPGSTFFLALDISQKKSRGSIIKHSLLIIIAIIVFFVSQPNR